VYFFCMLSSTPFPDYGGFFYISEHNTLIVTGVAVVIAVTTSSLLQVYSLFLNNKELEVCAHSLQRNIRMLEVATKTAQVLQNMQGIIMSGSNTSPEYLLLVALTIRANERKTI